MARTAPHESMFDENIKAFKEKLLASIVNTPPGDERDTLLRKVAQLENAEKLASSLRPAGI